MTTVRTDSLAKLLVGPVTDRNIRILASWKRERYTGVTGTTLSLMNHVVAGQEMVFKNGALLDYASAYTIAGDTLTFAVALVAGDVILISYLFRTS